MTEHAYEYVSLLDPVTLKKAQAEALLEQDPPVLPVALEKINDAWHNYVKGHNPYNYFGMFDVVRFDTFWLDT